MSITLEDALSENATIKRDLQNAAIYANKLKLDAVSLDSRQVELSTKGEALATRYLADIEKWVAGSVNANNYASCKQRLLRTIEWCREIGFAVPEEKEHELLATLKRDYELAVRAALEREEQQRIKAQIREEQAREREIEREVQALERERAAVQAALQNALEAARGEHTEEVERLRQRLEEAEARKERTVSQAQLTRAGHIYVISNIGSFGESVFKVGMTRRLDPSDRIRELGDASVPFPFDVHMMISSHDAPKLESEMHRELHRFRVNKANPRKEYFRVALDDIRAMVEKYHGEVSFIADAEALEYRQSIEMSEQDQEFIEQAFHSAEQDLGLPESED